jgi:carboxymethylenebutenolidase
MSFALSAIFAVALGIVTCAGNISLATEPEAVTFPVDEMMLHGDLVKPEGDGPFPAVLWSHGGANPAPGLNQYAASSVLGELFSSRGYVLFIPHRRGYGRSPRHALVDQFRAEKQIEVRNRLQLELMDIHMRDVIGAIQYLEKLPFVDRSRIAVAGWSYGGSLTVFASERNLPIRAAVNCAGGALSWMQSPDLRERMLRSVRAARVPIYLIQAENDYDLNPSRALAQEMEQAKKPHQLKIFPAHGSSAREGHDFCVSGGKVWESEVFSFLEQAMQR